MSVYLVFDPEKVRSLKCPFTFFVKPTSEKDKKPSYQPYSDKNLYALYNKKFGQDKLGVLTALTAEQLKLEVKWYKASYQRLNPRKSLEDYIENHLSEYYFKYLRLTFNILSTNPQLYHKIQVDEKRYQVLPCHFNYKQVPELSFKVERKEKKLSITTFFKLNDKTYNATDFNRNRFLICKDDNYYLLKKADWQLLEEIAGSGGFSHSTYLEKYHEKLNKYPLDLEGVFEEETREVNPKTIIQISELSGEMLVFLPRWDYQGTIVESNKPNFTIYEGQKRITYIRNKEAEEKTLEFLQNAHPNFKGNSNFYLKFEEASRKNWFFNFYHEHLKDNFTITGMDMLGYFRYSPHQVQSNFKITRTMDNMVTAEFTTHFGKDKIPTKSLQKALKQGDRFVLLKDSSLG